MTNYLGKSCSFCLPRVPFVNCRQFMYLVISLLVLRAGYGIWIVSVPDHCLSFYFDEQNNGVWKEYYIEKLNAFRGKFVLQSYLDIEDCSQV